jgi:hypothetical protein
MIFKWGCGGSAPTAGVEPLHPIHISDRIAIERSNCRASEQLADNQARIARWDALIERLDAILERLIYREGREGDNPPNQGGE